MPSKRENKAIDEVCVKFKQLESFTKHLQSDNCTIADARMLFDGIIEAFPTTKDKLSARARIVQDADFEIGKIQMVI